MPEEKEYEGDVNYEKCIAEFHSKFTEFLSGKLTDKQFKDYISGLNLEDLYIQSRKDRIAHDIITMYLASEIQPTKSVNKEPKPNFEFNYLRLLQYAKSEQLISDDMHKIKLFSAKILHWVFSFVLSETGLKSISQLNFQIGNFKFKVSDEYKMTGDILNRLLSGLHQAVSSEKDLPDPQKLKQCFLNGIKHGYPIQEIAIRVLTMLIHPKLDNGETYQDLTQGYLDAVRFENSSDPVSETQTKIQLRLAGLLSKL